MARKDFFLIVDTETTQDNLVADFAAVVTDRKGTIHKSCAVLVRGIFDHPRKHPLFFDSTAPAGSIWSKTGKDARYARYNAMLDGGQRMLASVPAINKWLAQAAQEYKPILSAYNLPFDLDKCAKTDINLSGFNDRFCLWALAYSVLAQKRQFRQFILENHMFNAPTALGNMTYKTDAQTIARFVLKNKDLPDEPHTALEDIVGYEIPILVNVLKRARRIDWRNPNPYNWREVQVNQWFKAK